MLDKINIFPCESDNQGFSNKITCGIFKCNCEMLLSRCSFLNVVRNRILLEVTIVGEQT